MSRQRIPMSECALLSRSNAKCYVGCLGDARFDREVAPYVRARLIGRERFYLREDLDVWVRGGQAGGVAADALLDRL